MTRRELINMVKTRVDELSPLDDRIMLISPKDEKPIDSFADGLLDECAKEILMNAPAWKLEGETAQPTPQPNRDGSGSVSLPDGFLRLIEFKMAGWKRPVTQPVEAGSPMAAMQANRFIRGGLHKPVCVLRHAGGGRMLDYYSVKKQHVVERFVYAGVKPAEDIDLELQDALAWLCASRILQITGRGDLAKMANERGMSLL